jgi:hypothetical protein
MYLGYTTASCDIRQLQYDTTPSHAASAILQTLVTFRCFYSHWRHAGATIDSGDVQAILQPLVTLGYYYSQW